MEEEKEEKEEIKYFSDNHIQRLSKDQLEDVLSNTKVEIISRVSHLSKCWKGLIDMNARKEKLEERLSELGFHQD